MKCPAVVLAILLVVFGIGMTAPLGTWAAESQAEQHIHFKWAFEAMVERNGISKPIPITRDTVLKTGDQLRMMLELQKPCFVYVIYRDPQDAIQLLFPYDLQQFNGHYETSKPYAIPQDGGWFRLDEQVGHEQFYLLASSQRLVELETDLNNYASADDTKKPELASQIVTTIRKLRRQYFKFAKAAERPIPIGGNRRLVVEGVDVAAHHFYGKTFTIDHQ